MANPYPARIAQPHGVTPILYLGLVNSGQKPPAAGFAAVDPVYDNVNGFSMLRNSTDGTDYVAVAVNSGDDVVGFSVGGLSISGWEVFHVGAADETAPLEYKAMASDGEAFGLIGSTITAAATETFYTIQMAYSEYDSNVVTDVGSSLVPREDVIDWGGDYGSNPRNTVIYQAALAPKTAGGLAQALFPIRMRTSLDPNGFNNRLIGLLAGPSETIAVTIAETTDATHNIFADISDHLIAPAADNSLYSGMLTVINTSTTWENEGADEELTYVQFKTTPLYASVGVPGDADCELFEPFLNIDDVNVPASDLGDTTDWRSLGDGFIILNPVTTGDLSDKSWYWVDRDWTTYQLIRIYALDEDVCAIFTADAEALEHAIYDYLYKDQSGNWFVLAYDADADEDIILMEGDPETPFNCPSSISPFSGSGDAGEPRIRAWTYTIDGHDFCVFRIANRETLIYDTYSQQWSIYSSDTYSPWRAYTGRNWQGGRGQALNWSDVIVGDDTNGALYFLSPDDDSDDDAVVGSDTPHPFRRRLTGQIVTKPGYAAAPCYGVQLFGSVGSDAGSVNLAVSDDLGHSYDDMGDIDITSEDYNARADWLSLGSMTSPGRLFRFTDTGALKRIDGIEMEDG